MAASCSVQNETWKIPALVTAWRVGDHRHGHQLGNIKCCSKLSGQSSSGALARLSTQRGAWICDWEQDWPAGPPAHVRYRTWRHATRTATAATGPPPPNAAAAGGLACIAPQAPTPCRFSNWFRIRLNFLNAFWCFHLEDSLLPKIICWKGSTVFVFVSFLWVQAGGAVISGRLADRLWVLLRLAARVFNKTWPSSAPNSDRTLSWEGKATGVARERVVCLQEGRNFGSTPRNSDSSHNGGWERSVRCSNRFRLRHDATHLTRASLTQRGPARAVRHPQTEKTQREVRRPRWRSVKVLLNWVEGGNGWRKV